MFPILTAIGSMALYKGLVVRSYVLQTDKWERGSCLRFAVAADLHSLWFGHGQTELLGLLRELAPDYILLPGDILDDHRHPAAAVRFMQGAARLAPTFYAPGNHEYRTYCFEHVVGLVRGSGVTPLLDRGVPIDTAAGPLLLAGCEDSERGKHTSYDAYQARRRAFTQVGASSAYTVLLAHRPEHSGEYAALGFDLAVSGHAHGGQARIPGLCNGIFASGQGLFPRYVGGCYRQGEMDHVVSRGLAVFDGLPRVFNPPELVLVQVVGTRMPL